MTPLVGKANAFLYRAREAITLQALQTSLGMKPIPLPNPRLQRLRKTARALWMASFGLLWIGLTTTGWERTEYSGTKTVAEQSFHQTIIGTYGLWNVAFELTSGRLSVSYLMWSAPHGDRWPLTLVRLTQALTATAVISGFLGCLTYIRSWCSRIEPVKVRYASFASYLSASQFVCTAVAIIVWRLIRADAFSVFCTENGCVSENEEGIIHRGVYYSWAFVLLSAILSLFLVLVLWREAHWVDEEEEEEDIQLGIDIGGQQPRQEETKTPRPIGPIAPVGYQALSKQMYMSPLRKDLDATPSWLVGAV